jgi:adenine deaminase
MTALKAMTLWPAWQHFEEDRKGSIEAGKLADFVILSDDPTAVDPEKLDQLRVLITIKEDKVVYDAENSLSVASPGPAESHSLHSTRLPLETEFEQVQDGQGDRTGIAE